jgi:hypothetical protein
MDGRISHAHADAAAASGWEQQLGIEMGMPMLAQAPQGRPRQQHVSVLDALTVIGVLICPPSQLPYDIDCRGISVISPCSILVDQRCYRALVIRKQETLSETFSYSTYSDTHTKQCKVILNQQLKNISKSGKIAGIKNDFR